MTFSIFASLGTPGPDHTSLPVRHWTRLLVLLLGLQPALAATEDSGRGFLHHGVAVPISGERGTVATVDGQGHDVVLSWLNDYRGGYE